MKLWRNKTTGEMYVQLYDENNLMLSAYTQQTVSLDDFDIEEIEEVPAINPNKEAYTLNHIIEEKLSVNDIAEHEYHLKDVLYLPVGDDIVAFRVEHISQDKVYLVAVDAVGESTMNDMADFLKKFEDTLPAELRNVLCDIEHIVDGEKKVSKVSLLSMANFGKEMSRCTGEDDIPFDGMLTEAERCKNLDGETEWYWTDTPYAGYSTYFCYVGYNGYAGNGDSANNAGAVVPCLSIKRTK